MLIALQSNGNLICYQLVAFLEVITLSESEAVIPMAAHMCGQNQALTFINRKSRVFLMMVTTSSKEVSKSANGPRSLSNQSSEDGRSTEQDIPRVMYHSYHYTS